MDLLNNNNRRRRTKARQPYYYIWAIVNGRLYVDGAYENKNDALRFGTNKIKV